MAPEAAVVCDALVKEYRSQGKLVKALDGVTLSMGEGEVFGLLGPNGAGKTTLVKILATLLRADAGRAWGSGFNVEGEEEMVRRVIGYAGQDSERSCYFRLTAEENLAYFAAAYRGVQRHLAIDRAREMADAFGFSDRLSRQFITLSGGEKQTVVVMRALLHKPGVVFLDEPSKSLDPITAKRVRGYLREYARRNGATVCVTTHNMAEAEELSDRLALVHKGRLLFVGTPSQFIQAVHRQETIEIDSPGLDKPLLEQLSSMEGVLSVSGDNPVKLVCGDAFETLPIVLELLKKQGVRVPVRMGKPTLEESFIHLVENDGGGTGA